MDCEVCTLITRLRTTSLSSSLHLAHHILHSPHLLFPSFSRGQLPPCIELGAGTGFLSILLAQLGSDVIATDLDGPGDGRRQAPLQRLMHNVQLSEDRNDSSQFQLIDADAPGPCRVEALDWSDASLPPHERPPIWKELKENNLARTVLAADVVSLSVKGLPGHRLRFPDIRSGPCTDAGQRHSHSHFPSCRHHVPAYSDSLRNCAQSDHS